MIENLLTLVNPETAITLLAAVAAFATVLTQGMGNFVAHNGGDFTITQI